jgi:N-acyl-L-homoserine lactone synthetase
MEMDATFATGRLTFSERLGWDVTVKDGYERDEFDDANRAICESDISRFLVYCSARRLTAIEPLRAPAGSLAHLENTGAIAPGAAETSFSTGASMPLRVAARNPASALSQASFRAAIACEIAPTYSARACV